MLLFRGVNVKVPGIFDVTFDDGRAPNETIAPFTEEDMARLETLGLDVVRLPINWSALEPQPEAYSEAFLKGVDAFLDLAWQHHIHVLIDMHQDAYSKEIGEDGAPRWAIVPAPAMVLGGPYDDARRLSAPVLAAGFSFFDDKLASDGRSLQQAFIAAAQTMVARWAPHPALLGYEAFNEPVVLDQHKLDAFHTRFADGVHAIDADAPVLFEPVATRNQTDQTKLASAPWSSGPGAYAPHISTGWFSQPDQHGWASENPASLEASMVHAEAEAAAWNTPMFVTEYGCDQSVDRGPKWIDAELDLQDRFLASSTMWVFREAGTWSLSSNDRVEREATARALARPYPRAVAGELLAIERPSPTSMKLRYRATPKTAGLAHVIAVSPEAFASYTLSCDGVQAQGVDYAGWAEVTCPSSGEGEHVLELVGTAK
jgi:endoglycosylceramidase